MGKVDLFIVLTLIVVTMTVTARALPLTDNTKCKAGICPDFLYEYAMWTKDSDYLPIPEIMEQVNCLLHDMKSMKNEVFRLKRELHKKHRKHANQ